MCSRPEQADQSAGQCRAATIRIKAAWHRQRPVGTRAKLQHLLKSGRAWKAGETWHRQATGDRLIIAPWGRYVNEASSSR